MSKFSDQIRSVRSQLSKLFKPSLAFARSVLIASAIVTVPLIAIRQVGILESAELNAYDMMLSLRPDESPDPRLLIVGITEADIQKLRQWPISDRKIAEILQKLEAMQPRVIGLDILRDVPLGEGRKELTALLQKSDRIVGVCLVTDGSIDNPGSPPPPGMPENRVGFADFSVDPGGILRRALLFMKPPTVEVSPSEKHLCNDNSHVLASFNLQLVLRYLEAEKILPEVRQDQSLWLGSTHIKQLAKNEGGYKNADVRGYQILINYRSRRPPARQVRLTDVLEGKIAPNLVKDKVVLIGYTTDTVKDLFYTPYSAGKQRDQIMFGIVAHAQVVSQLLSTVLDKRALFWFWPEWAEMLWISAWSIVGGTLALRIAHPTRLAIAFLVMLGVCCSVSFGIFMLGGWVPVVVPSLALIITGSSIVSAERFNKSDYGKAITAKVKQVFKIEIDQQKKDEEVAAVINQADLDKLKQIREVFNNSKQENSETERHKLSEKTVIPPVSPKAKIPPDDYLSQLQQKAKQHKQRSSSDREENSQTDVQIDTNNSLSSSETQEITVNSPESSNTQDPPDDYLSQLQQKAKQHKQRSSIDREENSQTYVQLDTNSSPNSGETQEETVGSLKSSTVQSLPQALSELNVGSPEPPNAESPPDDYLAQLQQKAKQHKQRSSIDRPENSQTYVPIDTNSNLSSGETQSQTDIERSLQAKAQQMRERRNSAKREASKSQDLPETED